MPIDCYAGEPHFADHLAAVWNALAPEERGQFLVRKPWPRESLRQIEPGDNWDRDPQRPILVASYSDLKRARRDGREHIARIEHGAGQSYSDKSASYAGGRDAGDVELFLTPNEYSASRWREAYPQARVEVVGCPKLDMAPVYQPEDPPLVVISFHADFQVVPETRSCFAYYRNELPGLAKAVNLAGHGHPLYWQKLEGAYRAHRIDTIPDFHDVLRRAAVYVCDNSSSIFEFAATGRPVVILNRPDYRRWVNHGLRFWEATAVGLQCDNPEDLVPTVELALTDPCPERREAALDLVYAYRTGAAARAADVLTDWAKGVH